MRLKPISVDTAAKLIGQSNEFVRIGMQQNKLRLGTCLKMSKHFVYDIRPLKLAIYLGITTHELEKKLDFLEKKSSQQS